MTPARVKVDGDSPRALTQAVAREIVAKHRNKAKLAAEAKPTSLMRQLYNVPVDAPLEVGRNLSGAELRQSIIHFQQPENIPGGRRCCGIPVTVVLSEMGVEIETRLVPQWRFGSGMRGAIINEALKGKTHLHMKEVDGKLVLTLK